MVVAEEEVGFCVAAKLVRGAGAGAGQSMADSRVPIGRPLALALPTLFSRFIFTHKKTI